MNDAFLQCFIVYCCTPKVLYNHVGGWGGGVSPQPPSVCSVHLDDAMAATAQWLRSPQTSYRWRGERIIEPIKCMGLLGDHDRQEPVEGIWPGHRGYTPTLYEKCHGIFNDHRVSGPRFNVSSERRCFLTGALLGPTQTAGWAPPAGLTNTSSNLAAYY